MTPVLSQHQESGLCRRGRLAHPLRCPGASGLPHHPLVFPRGGSGLLISLPNYFKPWGSLAAAL